MRKPSPRILMLQAAITNAMNSAHMGDYFNAVIEMRSAANVTNYKLPPPPYGVPDVKFGNTWKQYRWYYAQNFPTVFTHVDAVLKKLSRGMIQFGEDDDSDE